MTPAPNTNVLAKSPGWSNDDDVLCVVCPDCAFTFDAAHVTQASGRYDCPVCAADQLEAALKKIRDDERRGYGGPSTMYVDERADIQISRLKGIARDALAALAHDTERPT